MDYIKFYWPRFLKHTISLPLIWLPLPFILLVDVVVEVYHQICFPLYGIEKVKRSKYIQVVDRAKLSYLAWHEKLGCMYCGYVNGYLLYFKEIAGRTEKYWCGIMHARKPAFKAHIDQREQNFAKYGDEKDFKKKYLKK